jgi:hypothetical protein
MRQSSERFVCTSSFLHTRADDLVVCKLTNVSNVKSNHLIFNYSASLIQAPIPAPSGPSQEEIRKIVAEYKAREEKKSSKADEKDKDDDKDKKDDKEKEKEKPTTPIPSSPSPVPAASHRKFALHRQIFEMRRDDIKRKEQGVKAREVGKGASCCL